MLFLLLACTFEGLSEKNTDDDTGLEENETHSQFDEEALLAAIESDVNRMQATAFSMAVLRDGEVIW